MEQLVAYLMSLVILGAVIYALVRATLAPIHAKLDRLEALVERFVNADSGELGRERTNEGTR